MVSVLELANLCHKDARLGSLLVRALPGRRRAANLSHLSETMAEGAAATADGAVKTVFLVRHAQSEQNVASARFAEGDISALIDIAAIGYDAPLSKQGESQLREASLALDGFAAQRGIALVAHSPYQRAVHTARSLFAEFPRPLVQLPPLHERTMSEFFFPFLLDRRVAQVCSWLDAREERVIALVGHGAFFARCLGASTVQPNVSIIEATYSPAAGFVPRADDKFAYAGFSEPEPPDKARA